MSLLELCLPESPRLACLLSRELRPKRFEVRSVACLSSRWLRLQLSVLEFCLLESSRLSSAARAASSCFCVCVSNI